MTLAETSEAIGVTRIDGETEFSVDQSNPTAALNLSGDLPAAATEIAVRFRIGTDIVDVTAPITGASSIPLAATDSSDDLVGDLVWVTYVIRDDVGRALDTGGRLVP